MPGSKSPDEDVRLALELTNLCKSFHSLPRPGGILDQDFYHIALLSAGLYGMNKLEEKKRIEAERNASRRR